MQKIAPGMLSGMVFCAHNPLKSSKKFACGAANFIGFALLIIILLPVQVCAIRIQRHNYLKLMTTPVVCCTGSGNFTNSYYKTQSKLYITQEENYWPPCAEGVGGALAAPTP